MAALVGAPQNFTLGAASTSVRLAPRSKKSALGEAEHAGEQRRRHLLDAGIVFLDRVIEEAAAGRDLVFEIGQFARELLEVGVGLEVRIGLRQRDQPAERAGELRFPPPTPAPVPAPSSPHRAP